jgi:outer membrane receptor for ferrienterochelin and colicin
MRLTFRPVNSVTLVSRYEYQLSTIHTKPDSASGLGDVEASEMTSHIFSQNASWVPWSRLSLQAGFNYVLSETKTPVSDQTQAILNAQNNYLTLNFNSTFAVDNKSDLNLGYTYYRSDDYSDNSSFGVPYGAGATEHGVSATLVRRITDSIRLTVRYGFFHYEDETSGGHNNYDAHAIFTSVQYRF